MAQGASSSLVGREDILEDLQELVPSHGQWIGCEPVFLCGPRGAGTSALAGEFVSMLRSRLNGQNPVVIHVDVSAARCTHGDPSHGVAAALLRHFQQDAPVQGSSTCRIMWWFLHRVVAESRPVIVWLDQVRRDVRTLDGVVGPLLEPDPFVKGTGTVPPVFVVASGNITDDLWSATDNGHVKQVRVPTLPVETVREIVMERARHLGQVLATGALTKVMDILAIRGNNLTVMEEVLKVAAQRAKCHGMVTERDIVPPARRARRHSGGKQIELHMLEVLRKAGGRVTMGHLVKGLSETFVKDGECAPTGGSIRRWAVRLERAGLVERRVVMGGMGGTRSTISLPGHLLPVWR